MHLRPVALPADLPGLDRLFRRCHAADSHWSLGEHEYLDLLNASGEPLGLVLEEGGDIVGYGHVTPTDGAEHRLGVAIDPMHRSVERITAVLEASMALAKEAGATRLRFWVFQPAIAGILHHHGFELERELRQLRCDLPNRRPGPAPAGITVRPFAIGRDEQAWLDVNNRAFAGHPENGNWTIDVLRDRMEQPWFDAAGFLMAWAQAELVGFCWTKVHGEGVGEIYVIAVDPAHQQRGLGRFLALAGLEHLATAHDCSTGMLYVDAGNEPALVLYRSLGFWMDHVDRSFVADL